VLERRNIVSLAAGNNLSAAVEENGKVYFWNCDDLKPHLLPNLEGLKIVKIALSPTHCAVITDSEELLIWSVHELHGSPSRLFVGQKVKNVALGWNFGLATCLIE